MIRWQPFRRQYCSFRTAQFRDLKNLSELPELSHGSILHVLDLFQMNGTMHFGPALDNPIINLNNFKLLITNVTHPSQCDKGPAPIAINKMILTNAGVLTNLMAYKRAMNNRVFSKYFDSVKDLPIRPGAQAVVNYNPLFRARIMGQRRKVRFMNMLWACVVNTIMQAPERTHFIHIPLESLMFERAHFTRVFKKYDRVATKFPEISTYLFLAHLYAILMKNISLPPRGQLEEPDEDGVIAGAEAFETDPATFDPELSTEDFLVNIANTIEKDPEAALEFIKTKDFENPYNVSIFEYLPARVFEQVNFILTCGGQYIIYNLRDLKELNGNSGSGIMRIIRHINMLAAAGAPSALPDEANDVMVSEDIVEVDEKSPTANQPMFVMPMTVDSRTQAIDQDLKELNDIDKILQQDFKTQMNPLTPKQRQHVEDISRKFKSLQINGKSLDELLSTVPPNLSMPKIDEPPAPNANSQKPSAAPDNGTAPAKPAPQANGALTPTENGVAVNQAQTPAIPNIGNYQFSSVAQMDQSYIQNQFDRDIAQILTFFNTKGMFLVDLHTTDVVDDLNTKTTFTARYEDINHKTHTISFTLPKPNQFGVFLDNGSLRAMRKQRVSNPITKASASRVTLNSNYNKLLVERNENAAHDFMSWFKGAVEKARKAGFKMTLIHGACSYPSKPLPYELTMLGAKYTKITFDSGEIFLDLVNRANEIPEAYRAKMPELEYANGVWFGYKGSQQFYMTAKGLVQVRDYNTDDEVFYGAFIDFVEWLTKVPLNPMTEYCELTVLSKKVPVIHPLAYRYGLTNMLKYCGVAYELVDRNARVEQRLSDIVIKFKDKKLIIERTPRVNALLFGGLCIYDFSETMYDEMDDKNVYYDMLSQKGLSVHLIKGLDSLFDLFIDPITRDVLREMNEPTDLRDLLIRAVVLLTTTEHKDASSATNFRFRGFEQITGIVYNEMAKAFAAYQNKITNGENHFSMSNYQIQQRILHEQLLENVSTINPLDDIKQNSKFSNSGSGGRSNDTFMIPDRNFSQDSVGIVSEGTVDNGKTGLNAVLPFNPIILNSRGMCTEVDKSTLQPDNVLSAVAMIYPCATQDDSKRANFLGIHASHYVPIEQSDVSRVRTGFEQVLASRTSNPVFSYAAQDDGVVTAIDSQNGVMVIKYANGQKICLPINAEYTNNSANGFYVDQQIAVNGFKVGDKFKKGDVITYNSQFFQADPYSKQVFWKIGILAKVALLDNGGTIEDAGILTKPLCDKMVFHPVHVKDIVLTTKSNIHQYAHVGQEVVSTDPLMIFEESPIELEEDDPELAARLIDLNKFAPKAEHTGTIAKIEVLYKAAPANMSRTVRALVEDAVKTKNARADLASDCANATSFNRSAPLTGTSRVGITDLEEDTLIVRFYVRQNKTMNPGDKLFFDSSLKSVCSTVYPESILTEDGQKVDACTSARGILARIITSPFLTGIGNSVLEKLEQNMLAVWDGSEPAQPVKN